MSKVKLFEATNFFEIEGGINAWVAEHAKDKRDPELNRVMRGNRINITQTETIHRSDVDKYQTLVTYTIT